MKPGGDPMPKYLAALCLLFSSWLAFAGGGNSVMVVDRRDARITMDATQVHHFIFLKQSAFTFLQNGVLLEDPEERIGFLRIGYCEFDVLFDEETGIITAFDYYGRTYEVRQFPGKLEY
jgi:hypothetical protein